MSKDFDSENCLNRGRGRGNFLRSIMKRLNADNSKPSLPQNNAPLQQLCSLPEDVKNRIILNSAPPPTKSTYIPIEIDENDESIYEHGINSGLHFEKLNEIEVKVSGRNIPEKIEEFDNSISNALMENIKKCRFTKPTPIQKHTIPIILTGKDLMAAAQTGSGKTVAYVLPIIQRLLKEPRPFVRDKNHSEPQVIIMAPTRELAVQINIIVKKMARGTGISSLVCYGGTLVIHQQNQVLNGCHVLVATPGRLNEFVQHGFITFASVRFLVIDEVDKMLDFESKSDVDKILDHFSMPSIMHRQTIMLSATLPDSIQQLATYYLNKNYIFLAVGIVNSASRDIQQHFYEVNRFNKRKHLISLLKKCSKGTIVFVKTKWQSDFLATYLCEKHIPSISIHGDRLQDQREYALNEFTKGKTNVLVATSVASRGLDIKCVNHVINYDMPQEIEEYVQRIGRTGRVGNQGIATSFFEVNRDSHLVEPIIKILSSANQGIPDWLLELGQKIEDNEDCNDSDQFGGTDIRIKSNTFYEDEDW